MAKSLLRIDAAPVQRGPAVPDGTLAVAVYARRAPLPQQSLVVCHNRRPTTNWHRSFDLAGTGKTDDEGPAREDRLRHVTTTKN
jgi:hypothetical protein